MPRGVSRMIVRHLPPTKKKIMINTQLYIASLLISFFSIVASYSTWHKSKKQVSGTGYWLLGYCLYFISIVLNLLCNSIRSSPFQIIVNSFECFGSYLQLFGFLCLYSKCTFQKKLFFIAIALIINSIGIYFQLINKAYLYRFAEIINNLLPSLIILCASIICYSKKNLYSKYVIGFFTFISCFFTFEAILYLTGYYPSFLLTIGSFGPLSWIILLSILVFSQNQITNALLTKKLLENLQQVTDYKESLLRVNNELLQANKDIIMILVDALSTRISEASDHVLRVSELTKVILNTMHYLEADKDQIINAATLHDIGKIGISDKLLYNTLIYTSIEKDQMKQHTIIGYEILVRSESPLLKTAALISLEHHENWDGSGYPLSKKGTEISLASRIVSVADVLDALTHSRSYKKAWSFSDSLQYLYDNKGKKFDPEIINILPLCENNLRKVIEEMK